MPLIISNSQFILYQVVSDAPTFVHWMAPEIIDSSTAVGPYKLDIWSLGCTVHEMATSYPPW